MLIYGSGRNFHSEIQHPASKKEKFLFSALKLRQGCPIVDIDVSFDRSIQYLCNEVIFDGSDRHFYSEIQDPTSNKYENFTKELIISDRDFRLSMLMSH